MERRTIRLLIMGRRQSENGSKFFWKFFVDDSSGLSPASGCWSPGTKKGGPRAALRRQMVFSSEEDDHLAVVVMLVMMVVPPPEVLVVLLVVIVVVMMMVVVAVSRGRFDRGGQRAGGDEDGDEA
ncbi:hypothetical protein MPL1032_60014 [Mesorhizobium plurifarium]|uniref:Transmembrane protein n=1 Tax=Mesorhizobium plurifarium TaxID=69974 RepID=A0A0K2W6K2_MESPL|nr:hypothetical protein MPL1032_60014 [Mesorhizobium plurifarium]